MGLAQKSGVLSVVAKYEYYCVRARYLVGHNTLIVRFDEAKDFDLRSQIKCQWNMLAKLRSADA